MATIIGRKKEQEELLRLFRKNQAQLIAVYGRRRVGKTFLIRETLQQHFTFYHTGLSPVELEGQNLLAAQLRSFASTLIRCGLELSRPPKDWFEAFEYLRDLIESKPKDERQVVFIDEMPWLDTPRSGFITAFEHFWNGWGAGQDNLMVVVCGSASSWIIDNLINSRGGLYNRVNAEIQLSPFTLQEAEQMLRLQDVMWSRYDILQAYMAVGGIPFYLNYLQPGMSLAQNIDMLYFDKKAKLKDEFERLFSSIFNHPDNPKAIIRALATRHMGLSRDELIKRTELASCGDFSKTLKALENSDFIQLYQPFGNTKREKLYRLTDPFCWFYLTQVEGKNRGKDFWKNNENTPTLYKWRGTAFEEACLLHIDQIKAALGVYGIESKQSAWTLQGDTDHDGHQIDLIIERADRVVNLCEMKFYAGEYEVTKAYDATMRKRITAIRNLVKARQNVQTVLVSSFGVKKGMYQGIFQQSITLDDLFRQE